MRTDNAGFASDQPPAAAPGTLQELLRDLETQTRRSPKRRVPARTPMPATPSYGQTAKRLFLLEFECRGDLGSACQASGCSLYDVRHWRTNDPMFERDFVLAAVGHVRMLKRSVESVAAGGVEPHANRAGALLANENRYVASDGRLDLRAWRDALKAFLDDVGPGCGPMRPGVRSARAGRVSVPGR